MSFLLPSYVLNCLETLEKNGFEAWCVGGAVRDHIMGKVPFDYDITTNARPENIIEIFPKTVPTGIQHGTITVVTDQGNIEITTYRSDGKYFDHRSPDSVEFKNSVEHDLKRRDFTMNAICYNPKHGFYDPENGITDINNKTIRAIGNPQLRFNEDALRIMRAFRFSAQLGFEIEEGTKNAAISLSYLLKDISVERVYAELKRAITANFTSKMQPLFKCGALNYIGIKNCELPSNFDVLPYDFSLRFAYLCKSIDIDPQKTLFNLKSDNKTINDVKIYSALLKYKIPDLKSEIKQMLNISDIDYIKTMFEFYKSLSNDITDLVTQLKEIIDNNEAYRIDMLDIDGNDLTELGFKGKEIGDKFQELLNHVILYPEDNKKDKLISLF